MPLYEYACSDCHRESELLVRGDETPECPECGSRHLERLLSVPAAPGQRSADLPVASGGMCGRSQCAMGGCQGLG